MVIDSANAARSLLCHLTEQDWDKDLLALFDIPRAILPTCRPVRHHFGPLKAGGVAMRAVNGDQNAALYSQGEPPANRLRVNLGTGAFILAPLTRDELASPAFAQSALLAGISSSDQREAAYSIEGTVNGAGAALDWLQQTLGVGDVQQMMQQGFAHSQTAIFINTVGGLGSPFWRNDIDAHFVDDFDPVEHPQAALAAVLESIVFLLQINHLAIRRVKSGLQSIDISGGLSQCDFLCQQLSNLSGLAVRRSSQSEATARGIAFLALDDVSSWQAAVVEKVFEPQEDDGLRRRFERFRSELAGFCDYSPGD